MLVENANRGEMPPCACGCQYRHHVRKAMPVPLLPNPEPLYSIPEWSPINKTHVQRWTMTNAGAAAALTNLTTGIRHEAQIL